MYQLCRCLPGMVQRSCWPHGPHYGIVIVGKKLNSTNFSRYGPAFTNSRIEEPIDSSTYSEFG